MKSITLELSQRVWHAPSEDGMFYRYDVDGRYNLWFVQHENGNIYSVSMAAKRNLNSEFEFYITDAHNDMFYPNQFTLCTHNGHMNANDIAAYIKELADAQELLLSAQHFFETSVHAEKYWSERAKEYISTVRLGDYDLDGVEITDDDYANIGRHVVMSRETLTDAVHQYLLSVREVLDQGLDDIEEDVL